MQIVHCFSVLLYAVFLVLKCIFCTIYILILIIEITIIIISIINVILIVLLLLILIFTNRKCRGRGFPLLLEMLSAVCCRVAFRLLQLLLCRLRPSSYQMSPTDSALVPKMLAREAALVQQSATVSAPNCIQKNFSRSIYCCK